MGAALTSLPWAFCRADQGWKGKGNPDDLLFFFGVASPPGQARCWGASGLAAAWLQLSILPGVSEQVVMSWRLVGTSPPYVELGPGSCSRLGEERGDKPRPRHAIRGVCTGCLVSYQSPPETAGMGRCRDRFCGFFNLIVSLSFFFFFGRLQGITCVRHLSWHTLSRHWLCLQRGVLGAGRLGHDSG